MTTIPEDLVEVILSRVPAKSLKRLRATCKPWNVLFKDKRFARKHFEKSPKQSLLLLLNKDFMLFPMGVNLHGTLPSVEVETNLSPLDSDYNNSCKFKISNIIHCDGFLLCTSEDRSRFVVWNPCTGQTTWFKPRFRKFDIDYRNFLLGYDDKRSCNHKKSYKILSYCHLGNVKEIYEFDSDTWRNILGDDIALGCETIYTSSSKTLKSSKTIFR